MSYQKEGRGNLRKQYVCMCLAPGREEKKDVSKNICHLLGAFANMITVSTAWNCGSHILNATNYIDLVSPVLWPFQQVLLGHQSVDITPAQDVCCCVLYDFLLPHNKQHNKHGIPGIDTADANLVKSQGTKCMPWCSPLNHPIKPNR